MVTSLPGGDDPLRAQWNGVGALREPVHDIIHPAVLNKMTGIVVFDCLRSTIPLAVVCAATA